MNANSVHYKRVKLESSEIEKLAEADQVILALLCYSISETNALWRAFLCANQETSECEVSSSAIAIQRHVLLRAWAAKLFELIESLRELSKNEKDQLRRSFLLNSIDQIEKCESESALKLVKAFRHEATNHSPVKAARKNLKHVSNSAVTDLFFNDITANCFMPFGEEVFFAARYNRFLKDQQIDGNSIDPFAEWLNWTIEATKQLIPLLDEFLTSFVFIHGQRPSWQEISVELANQVSADCNQGHIPIAFMERPS